MTEFLSNHYGDNAAPFDYSYAPPQGVNSQRLFGPYTFRVTTVSGKSGAQLYQDAASSAAAYPALFDQDAALAQNGYVATTARGTFVAVVANSAGWSGNTTNNNIVLTDPNTNFQESNRGYQYWGQLSPTGNATITGVVPGNYRMSIYQYGQWGETRVDNVHVTANKASVPQNVKFTPENFGSAAPIWTIGTPNRSANEFLNGHNADGSDNRNYWGSYNYWQEEANLGNNGKVVYYGTAVGANAATNDPNKWISNQWQVFNPSLYNPADNTKDLYPMQTPAYVGNPATYTGLPWEVHFTTTQGQQNQGQYVVLSVALAASESDLTVALNGVPETWTIPSTRVSDPNNRSGQAGLFQWAAFEFPTSDLMPAGGNNVFTFSVDKSGGVMYDALRMEITNTSANPSATGWQDYDYMSANPQIAPNDAAGLVAQNLVVPQYSTWNVSGGGSWGTGPDWTNASIPQQAMSVANFTGAISAASTVDLNANWTAGTVNFNNSNSYTVAPGTGGTLTMDNGAASAAITDAGGSHFITAPIVLKSNTVLTVGNAGDSLTISGGVSGVGGLAKGGGGTVTLSGSNTYGGGTTVNQGLLVIGSAASLPATTALLISGGATVRLAAGSGAGSVSSLAINGGATLDVANNALAVNYGSPALDPVAALAGAIAGGRNGGDWAGAGITSSAAAVSPTQFAVGYADGNSDPGTPAAANQLLIVYTLAGDANLDGSVGFADLLAVAQNYGSTGQDWVHGNLTYDPAGSVGFADLLIVAQEYGQSMSIAQIGAPAGFSPAWHIAAAQVPEPGPAALLAAAGIGLAGRRRRAGQRAAGGM